MRPKMNYADQALCARKIPDENSRFFITTATVPLHERAAIFSLRCKYGASELSSVEHVL
eukprot:IDg8088t1